MSLPSRERGLKSNWTRIDYSTIFVAPLAGAWIEIDLQKVTMDETLCRSPRGSVD